MESSFISLAEIFQDNLVFQRNKPILIRGTSEKVQQIQASFDDALVFEGTVPAGKFEIKLPPQEAAESLTFKIRNQDGKEIVIRNVDIGEVWIAGGQSNMEFPLLCERDGEAVINSANDEHLRYYEVGKFAFEGEREEHLKDDHRWNNWRKFKPEECTHFSAVGTYYALALRKALGIPVAIVGCNWGATSASAWLDEKLLREDPALRVYTDEYDAAVAKMNLEKYIKSDRKTRKMMGTEKTTLGSEMTLRNEATAPLKFPVRQLVKLMLLAQKTGPHDSRRPGGLYQTMVSHISGYTARGVIWYQGESDEHHASLYSRLFTKMIFCWRKAWKEDLPFLFVQLAPWDEWMAQDGRNYPELREQQQYVEDHVPGTHMVSIMDVGSQYDIHPKVKKPVGDRLALLALDQIYGVKQQYCHAPRIAKVDRDGKKITVFFDYAEKGLVADGDISSLFSLRQNGHELKPVAHLEKECVVLDCKDLSEGQAELAFAYRPYLKMNLFNLGRLPARPSAPQKL